MQAPSIEDLVEGHVEEKCRRAQAAGEEWERCRVRKSHGRLHCVYDEKVKMAARDQLLRSPYWCKARSEDGGVIKSGKCYSSTSK